MNIEKIDRVVFGVRDVIGVANFLSELLKMRFDRLDPELVIQGRKAIAALSPIVIEHTSVTKCWRSEGTVSHHSVLADVI